MGNCWINIAIAILPYHCHSMLEQLWPVTNIQYWHTMLVQHWPKIDPNNVWTMNYFLINDSQTWGDILMKESNIATYYRMQNFLCFKKLLVFVIFTLNYVYVSSISLDLNFIQLYWIKMSIELYFTNIREKEDEIRKYTIFLARLETMF